MNIHEYQAKELLRRFGVPVPEGGVAKTAAEAEAVARTLPQGRLVVKAQIHAGGRGKAGGIKTVDSPAGAAEAARQLLGTTLVTNQTGPQGRLIRRVLVEVACDIRSELYAGVLIDRALCRPVLLASSEGGMDIETLAKNAPEKILRVAIDPAVGLMPYQARKLAVALGLEMASVSLFAALYRAFVETDASLIELNPLVLTAGGRLLALDAKMTFDDNALCRHRDIADLRDIDEEDPREVEAGKFNLNYIGLSGNIGCMVNGAGLAMATMDIIQQHGGRPANFLDVGGGATAEQVAEAFRILCGDRNVRGILVNIFGGIMKCDLIATGIVAAARQVNMQVPLVVRLEGTNVELGKQILRESGLAIIPADSMEDAAQKITGAVQ